MCAARLAAAAGPRAALAVRQLQVGEMMATTSLPPGALAHRPAHPLPPTPPPPASSGPTQPMDLLPAAVEHPGSSSDGR